MNDAAGLKNALRTRFGHDDFRPGQEEAVRHLLSGEHTFVVMPTGAGKSLIYQLTALMLPGTTLIISPLIALMKDQVDRLTAHGIPAAYLNSTLTTQEQATKLQAVERGEFKIVYAAPERLRNSAFLRVLNSLPVSLLAVDEAHCVCQWGHDFRPDYLHIETVRRQWNNPLTVALTATAAPQMQAEIIRLLGLGQAKIVVTGFNRPNLFYEVRSTPDTAAKMEAIQTLLAELNQGACIIYAGTRRDAEVVNDFVRDGLRMETACYHAGLEPDERTRVQEAFLSGRLSVIAATNAFGMGLDRQDVRCVIHYDLPASLEVYYQETGRAGRDGKPARAVLLYSPQDRSLQEWFIENDTPSTFEMKKLWHALKRHGQEPFWCAWDDLTYETGLQEVKVRVGIAGLETVQAVTRLGDSGAHMRLRLNLQNEHKLGESLSAHEKHRTAKRAQLQAMVEYAESDACRRHILLEHFGESLPASQPACCDNCQVVRGDALSPAGTSSASLDSHQQAAQEILRALNSLRWEVGRERLVELLSGAKTKEMRQYDYDRNPYYGKLSRFNRQEIRALIDELIKQGYLKQVGSDRPVLHITPKARTALQRNIAIDLQITSPSRQPSPASSLPVNDTCIITHQMLVHGLTPEQIARQRGLKDSTVYEHIARLIVAGRIDGRQYVPDAIIRQVQKAFVEAGGEQPLSVIKPMLPESISYDLIRCAKEILRREATLPAAVELNVETNAPARRDAPDPFAILSLRLAALHTPKPEMQEPASPADHSTPSEEPLPSLQPQVDVASYLSRPHPRVLKGSWHAGFALDFHSRFEGSQWKRTVAGEWVFRLKYQGDSSALQPLVEACLTLIQNERALAEVDAIIPIPPTVSSETHPVISVANALAARMNLPALQALVKTRTMEPQKEQTNRARKAANVAGAFRVQANVKGKRLMLIDDLYDSGATLEEATRILQAAGATRICVLALTKTIHQN